MPKANYSDLRKKASGALRNLGMILNRKQVCADVAPISSAADQCNRQANDKVNSWGYDIANLVFRPTLPPGTLPLKAKEFRLELSISVFGHFDCDIDDRFSRLEINVEKYALGATGVELKSAWHIDRHTIDTKKDSPHITDEIHPLYHFQFGGAKMTKPQHQHEGTLLLAPPRLMHPPMDGILAIDFVLANYAGSIWKSLRQDSEYNNLVLPQFDQIWKPYFASVAESWSNPKMNNSGYLCPFIF